MCVFYLEIIVIQYDINPYPANYIYLNFHPFEVMSRHSDPQPKVVENYSYLSNLWPNIYKLNAHFVPNNSDLFG